MQIWLRLVLLAFHTQSFVIDVTQEHLMIYRLTMIHINIYYGRPLSNADPLAMPTFMTDSHFKVRVSSAII